MRSRWEQMSFSAWLSSVTTQISQPGLGRGPSPAAGVVLPGDTEEGTASERASRSPCEAQSPGLGNGDPMGPLDGKGAVLGVGKRARQAPKRLPEQHSCCAALLQSEFAQRPSPHWRD